MIFVQLALRDRKLIQTVLDFVNRRELGANEADIGADVLRVAISFDMATRDFRDFVPVDPDDYSSRVEREPFQLYDEYILDQIRLPGTKLTGRTHDEMLGEFYRYTEITTYELLRKNQAELIGWLDQIIKFNRLKAKDKRQLESEVAVRLGNVETRGIVSFHEGRLQRQLEYRLMGIEACYGYATALLLDESNGLLNRVGNCRVCGLYFVDFPKGRARPRVQFCSDKHANSDRQRRQRARDREAKAKS